MNDLISTAVTAEGTLTVPMSINDEPLTMDLLMDHALKEMVASGGTISPQETEFFMDLSEIKGDNLFRCRVEDDEDHIEALAEDFTKYKEAMGRGENPDYPFPPIWIYWQDGGEPDQSVMGHVLLAGFHRFQAANQAGMDKILVRVFEGTRDEAIWFAMRDNRTHGLRLKHGDLKLCIGKALRLFPDKTAALIAQELGCSRTSAYRIENELSQMGQLTRAEKRRGVDGKVRSTKRKPKRSAVPHNATNGNAPPSQPSDAELATSTHDSLHAKWTKCTLKERRVLVNHTLDNMNSQFPEGKDRLEFANIVMAWGARQKRNMSSPNPPK